MKNIKFPFVSILISVFPLLLLLCSTFGADSSFAKKLEILEGYSDTSKTRILDGQVVTYARFFDATSSSDGKKNRQMDVKSGGGFHAPLKVVWPKVIDFENYDDILPFVKETHWDSKSRLLKISAGIMMIKLDSLIKISEPVIEKGKNLFTWVVQGGDLLGSTGSLTCEKNKIGSICILKAEVIQKQFFPSETLFGMAVETGLTKITEKMKRVSELESVDDF